METNQRPPDADTGQAEGLAHKSDAELEALIKTYCDEREWNPEFPRLLKWLRRAECFSCGDKYHTHHSCGIHDTILDKARDWKEGIRPQTPPWKLHRRVRERVMARAKARYLASKMKKKDTSAKTEVLAAILGLDEK